jgi:hypothetical protein
MGGNQARALSAFTTEVLCQYSQGSKSLYGANYLRMQEARKEGGSPITDATTAATPAASGVYHSNPTAPEALQFCAHTSLPG